MAPTPEKALCGHSEGLKLKETDVGGKVPGEAWRVGYAGPRRGWTLTRRTENSEDSDEDLRAFTLHSLSSESEDEAEHPVPVVLSRRMASICGAY